MKLMQAFKSQYSSVFEAKVICDPVSRESKGFGFIRFSKKDEAERALKEMNGQQLLGKAIKVNYASQRLKNQNQPSNPPANEPPRHPQSQVPMGYMQQRPFPGQMPLMPGYFDPATGRPHQLPAQPYPAGWYGAPPMD
jgi:RNA recognition motif-containing protein